MKQDFAAIALENLESRPARGAWIETSATIAAMIVGKSRPARGAWIETRPAAGKAPRLEVAPRAGRVD